MALHPCRLLSLCAGVGGLDLGVRLAEPSARSVCYVEREAAAAAILVARMEDGWLHPAPIWSDLATFDAGAWRGAVDCVVSGDPCQPNSVAGRGLGDADERWLADRVVDTFDRSGARRLWRENVPGNADGQLAYFVPALERLGCRVAVGLFSARSSVLLTDASGCPSWPTATTSHGQDRQSDGSLKPKLDVFARQWMTPNVPNGGRTASHAIVKGRTLTREDGTKVQLGLEHQAKNWSTPTARIHKGGGQAVTRQDGKSRMDMLDWQAEAWSRSSLPDQPISAGPTLSPERRTLNPLFVEWLMGWPIGWTGSAPVETASSHWWLAMRGELSKLVSRQPVQATLL